MNNELTVTRHRLHSLILVTQTVPFYTGSQEPTQNGYKNVLHMHEYKLKYNNPK